MEQTAKPKALILLLIFIFIFIFNHTWLVHSRNLETSPSPSPSPSPAPETYEGRKANPRKGSFPATCHSKCNQCRPCVPVEVSIRAMAVEENQYYPIAWRCMCQSNIFSP